MASKRRRALATAQEHRRISLIDDLAEFDSFRNELLPALRQALKDGKSAEDIYSMASAAAAARAVTIAVKEEDSGKALAAIKEILDRDKGKAKERQEVTHKLEKLPEEQLDALLLSKLGSLEEGEADTDEALAH